MCGITRLYADTTCPAAHWSHLADWRNPHEYPHHPPTLLVQSLADYNADIDAALFYHQVRITVVQ